MNQKTFFLNEEFSLFICRYRANSIQTIGLMLVLDREKNILKQFCTLELPWKDNLVKLSRIPVGTYVCEKHNSPHHGNCFAILGVTSRSNILIHAGNYVYQTQGCILIGEMLKDINADGLTDVVASKKALYTLLDLMPDRFFLTIK